MCQKTISFTIPIEEVALRSTADMLNRLADADAIVVTKRQQPGPTVAVDPVAEFNADTPEAMGDRIDEAAAAAPPAPQVVAHPQDELDADDRPWDVRIDSGAKSKTADGRWKLRRGVDKTLIEKVLAEYKSAPVPEPAAEVPAPAPVVEMPAPAPVAPAPAAPTPPPPPVAELYSFADFKTLVMGRIKEEKLLPTDLQTACTMAGSNASGMMPSIERETPEMIDAIYKQLVNVWATRD